MSAAFPLIAKASVVHKAVAGAQWLVELACVRPASVVLAIVVDLSDSCGPLRNEAVKFPRLIAHMPRDTPVWVYRLSAYDSADAETHRVGHLQDGSVQVSQWLDDARLREYMARRGSLLRPTLESIAERQSREDVTHVKVVVFTDGELLDVTEVKVPKGIDIFGLTASSHDAKSGHWRRVLPYAPLFDLRDPRVDRAFVDLSHPFYGVCNVSWCHEDAALSARMIDLESGRILPVDQTPLVWNFVDRRLLLLLDTEKTGARPPMIECRSANNNEVIALHLTDDHEQIDAETVGRVAVLQESGTSTPANVVADVKATDPDFAEFRDQFLAAKTMAESRVSWIDPQGIARVWLDEPCAKAILHEDNHSRFDALLCIARLVPTNGQTLRILIVALEKRLQPALCAGPGMFFDFAELSEAVTIRYDMREARWMLSQGHQTRELDPRYSEEISLPLQDPSLIVLFSGPLR